MLHSSTPEARHLRIALSCIPTPRVCLTPPLRAPHPLRPQGAPLQLDGVPASRPLSSTPLSMYLSRVTSHVAANLTGDRWDASVGTPADLLPEVPPDGGW